MVGIMRSHSSRSRTAPVWAAAGIITALLLSKGVAAACAEDTAVDATVGNCGGSSTKRDNSTSGEEQTCDPIQYEPEDVAFCRRRPAWGGLEEDGTDVDVRARCQATLHYEPDPQQLAAGRHPYLSSSFGASTESDDDDDDDDADYDALPVMERPLLRRLQRCMDAELETHKDSKSSEVDPPDMPRPAISTLHRRTDGLPVMGVVAHALNEEEARSVHQLSTCLKRHVPDLFERRSFEETYEGGGNDVTYMAGFLQLLLPGVAIQLRRVLHLVWKEAGWGDDEDELLPIDVDEDSGQESQYSTKWWPDPLDETVGIRTTEHLSYDRWGSLGNHEDAGSDYTVLVALSDPSDYEGGEFSLYPEYDNDDLGGENDDSDTKISVKPDRLSAIVFLSNFRHGVDDIRTPGRRTMANEFWRYGDVPVMQMRPEAEHMVFGDPMDGFELDEEGSGDEERIEKLMEKLGQDLDEDLIEDLIEELDEEEGEDNDGEKVGFGRCDT